MRYTGVVIGILVVWGLWGTSTAQDGEFLSAENPFQDEFEYVVGTDLNPMVEVEGVRWLRFAVRAKGDREIDSTKDMPVIVEIDLLNTADKSAKITVIALLEDAAGTPLVKVECNTVGIGSDRAKDSVQKFKVRGAVLEATRKVYLFFEVQR